MIRRVRGLAWVKGQVAKAKRTGFSINRASRGKTYIDNSLLHNIIACSCLAFKLDSSKFNHFANFLQ